MRCWRSGENALLVMAEIRHAAGGGGGAAAGGGGDRLLAAAAICCWRWRWRSAARGGGGGGAVALLATARGLLAAALLGAHALLAQHFACAALAEKSDETFLGGQKGAMGGVRPQ